MILVFLGDVMLGRLVNDVLKVQGCAYPWGDTLDLLRTADVRVCNLECVLSDRGEPWQPLRKAFHFRTDSRNVEVLKTAGINMVSLANNHILDYGYEALQDTLETLDSAGIKRAGAGRNLAEASSPASLEHHGVRIALIAFTDNTPEWEAGAQQPGVFYVPTAIDDRRTKNLLERIEATRGDSDLLIVSAHWGPNWGYRPPASDALLGRALIDHGADIVFGHSCHVARGIELHRGRPILYSTGDFIDDYAIDLMERNDRSLMFFVETGQSRIVRLYLVPTVIRGFQAHVAQSPEREVIGEQMAGLCRGLGTDVSWAPDGRYLQIPIHHPSQPVL